MVNGNKYICDTCNRDIPINNIFLEGERNGEKVSFCSIKCQEEFEESEE